jgi:tRNA U55 pseudouridine synthase TruB
MKKLILIVILSFLSTQSFAGSCPQGSEVIRTISPDGSYFLSSCATMEEIRIQKEDAFLKKQDLTTDSLEQLIIASVKLGISSLEAIYDVDGNLLNRTELIDELISISTIISSEESIEMNLALETLPNQEAFSFDNIVVIEDSNGNPIMPDSDLPSSFNDLFPDGDLLPTTSGSGSSAGSGSVPTAGTPSASPPTDTYKAPDT